MVRTPALSRRLRIAYLVHGVGGRETGVRTKILTQARIWRQLDPSIEVGLFVRCEAGAEDAWRGEPNVVSVRSSALGIVGRLAAREVLTMDVVRWRPDAVYLRQSTVSPSLLLLASRSPTTIEVNSDDLRELRIRSTARYLYALASRDLLLRRARRLIVPTHELARHPSIRRLRRPVGVVPNSVDLDNYPELAAPRNPRPRLVFIGAPGLPWAGIDKIGVMARTFPEWRFDLIGPRPAELDPRPANISMHGSLSQSEYLPIVAQADIGIGPLALERKGLTEASALKVAEYLAYGLPCIVSGVETAFPDGAPFLLELPTTEDNVAASASELETFVTGWRGRRVPRAAIAAVGSATVEVQRLRLIGETMQPAG